MMIEYRSFEGDATQLSQFIVESWRATYAGKMSVPDWSPEYLNWQLGVDQPENQRNFVAAYHGTRQVGAALCFQSQFKLHGQDHSGVQSSWLSVDPEFRGQGVAKGLVQHLRKRLAEEDLAFKLGYVFEGARQSLGPKFWHRKSQQDNTTSAGRVGFWSRLLDADRAARWNTTATEAWMTRFLSRVIPTPKYQERNGMTFRPFQIADTDCCLDLANLATEHCDLRILWNADQFQKHCTGFGQCLLAESDGIVKGCVMFHLLPIYGNTLEPIGIVDGMFMSQLSLRQQKDFMDAVLFQMRQQGAILALKLRGGDYSVRQFLRYGWFWRPANSSILIQWSRESPDVPPIHTKHLLWR